MFISKIHLIVFTCDEKGKNSHTKNLFKFNLQKKSKKERKSNFIFFFDNSYTWDKMFVWDSLKIEVVSWLFILFALLPQVILGGKHFATANCIFANKKII